MLTVPRFHQGRRTVRSDPPDPRRVRRRVPSKDLTVPTGTDIRYDGRFTFVRLAWRGGSRFGGGWSSAWNHDYPRAEQHLSQILRELTYLDIQPTRTRTDA